MPRTERDELVQSSQQACEIGLRFTDEKLRHKKLSNMAKVTQLGSDGTVSQASPAGFRWNLLSCAEAREAPGKPDVSLSHHSQLPGFPPLSTFSLLLSALFCFASRRNPSIIHLGSCPRPLSPPWVCAAPLLAPKCMWPKSEMHRDAKFLDSF